MAIIILTFTINVVLGILNDVLSILSFYEVLPWSSMVVPDEDPYNKDQQKHHARLRRQGEKGWA